MKNKFSQIIALMLSVSLICELSYAQNTTTVVLPGAVSAVSPTAGDVTNANTTDGIKGTGEQSASKNNGFMIVAGGLGVFLAYQAVVACSTKPYGSLACILYSGGAALSLVAIMKIMQRKNENQAMAKAVTVDPDGASTPGKNPLAGADGEGNPQLREIQNKLDSLKPYGIKVNPDGTITANGRKINLGDMSAGALKAAGASDKDIKSFMATVAAEKKKLEAQAKVGDNNSELFGDTMSGSGSKSSGVMDGSGFAPAGARPGLDRDPAQVAGMSVNYAGEQIGVGADNIYMMIHRRYDLHRKGGAFFDPSLTLAPGADTGP